MHIQIVLKRKHTLCGDHSRGSILAWQTANFADPTCQFWLVFAGSLFQIFKKVRIILRPKFTNLNFLLPTIYINQLTRKKPETLSQWFRLRNQKKQFVDAKNVRHFLAMNSKLRIRFTNSEWSDNFVFTNLFTWTSFLFAKLRIYSYEFVRVFSMLLSFLRSQLHYKHVCGTWWKSWCFISAVMDMKADKFWLIPLSKSIIKLSQK